jgi:hypothetical protein
MAAWEAAMKTWTARLLWIFFAFAQGFSLASILGENHLAVCRSDLAQLRERRAVAQVHDVAAVRRQLDSCLEANVTCAMAIESAESISSACRRFLEVSP